MASLRSSPGKHFMMDLETLAWPLIAVRAGIPIAAAVLGAVVGVLGTGASRKTTSLVVNFSAGAFLAVALLHLLPEAAEHTGWPWAMALGTLGGLGSYGIARRTGAACPACVSGIHSDADHQPRRPSHHHHSHHEHTSHRHSHDCGHAHDHGHCHDHAHTHSHSHDAHVDCHAEHCHDPAHEHTPSVTNTGDGPLRAAHQLLMPLIVAVSIHSAMDGLALSADHHHHGGELMVLALLLHKFPEGMAIAAICRSLGSTVLSALGITFGVQCWTLIGAVTGMLLGTVSTTFVGIGLSLVAGSLIYIVLLNFFANRQRGATARTALAAMAGALLIAVVVVTGH